MGEGIWHAPLHLSTQREGAQLLGRQEKGGTKFVGARTKCPRLSKHLGSQAKSHLGDAARPGNEKRLVVKNVVEVQRLSRAHLRHGKHLSNGCEGLKRCTFESEPLVTCFF